MAGFLSATINFDFVPDGCKAVLSPVRTENYDGETLPKGTLFEFTMGDDTTESGTIPVKGAGGSIEYLCELYRDGTRYDRKKFYVAYSDDEQYLSALWDGGTEPTDATIDYINAQFANISGGTILSGSIGSGISGGTI